MKEEIKESQSCKNEQKTQCNLKGINLIENDETNCNDNDNSLFGDAYCCQMICDENEYNFSVLFDSMQSNLNEISQLIIKNEKDEDIKDTFLPDTSLKDYLNHCEKTYSPQPLTTTKDKINKEKITEIKIKKYPPIPNKKKKKQKKRCWNCGSEGHLNKNCPALSPEIKEKILLFSTSN